MEKSINTREELNSAVIQLQAHSIQMCNDSSTEDVAKNFVAAKDLLIAIYKYNVEKLSSSNAADRVQK